MLLPTPKLLIVAVVACLFVLFAVNGLHVERRVSDWPGSSSSSSSSDDDDGVVDNAEMSESWKMEDRNRKATTSGSDTFKDVLSFLRKNGPGNVVLQADAGKVGGAGRSMEDRVRGFFAPVVMRDLEGEYRAPDGKVFGVKRNGGEAWKGRLGKKILVVDIDTRVPDGTNQILNEQRIDYDANPFQAGGDLVSNCIFDHYLYAQIHGYDYKFYQAQKKPGYHDTWILPQTLLELLSSNNYTHIVTMDADVSVTHPEVPLEWLFNRWGVSNRTSIAMPWDVIELRDGEKISVDGKGIQVLNTGLVVVQDLPYTREMLEVWRDCPLEGRWPGCARWKDEWSHEQRAFSEFVRYEFNPDGDNIVSIPCDDAMSWPGMKAQFEGHIASDCNGTFFRHHTINKALTKGSVATSILQLLFGMMQDEIRAKKDEIWVVEQPKHDQQ